jgi:hypothetical protein
MSQTASKVKVCCKTSENSCPVICPAAASWTVYFVSGSYLAIVRSWINESLGHSNHIASLLLALRLPAYHLQPRRFT